MDDFPREIEERREKLEKYDKMKKLIKTKDDIIWNLLCEKKEREEKNLNQLKEKAHNEISEWVKLSDKYAMELKKYDLICNFCGCFMEETTINTACNKNGPDDVKNNLCKGNVPADCEGNRRHYFGRPIDDQVKTQSLKTQASANIHILSPKNEKISNNLNDEIKSKASQSQKNPFENNILNDSKFASYRSRSSSPPGNLRYSDENIKGLFILIFRKIAA